MSDFVTINVAANDLYTNWQVRRTMFLTGPVGVGKTSIVHQLAERVARETGATCKVIDKRASQMAPTDVTLPFPDPATGLVRTFVPDWLPRVDRDGAQGILMLDELSDAPVSVQAPLNQLVLEGKLPGYELPTGWLVIATGNRMSDRAAAGKVSRATANRFAIIPVGVSARAVADYFASIGVCTPIVAFIQQAIMEGRGDECVHKYPDTTSGDALSFPTPRSIHACDPYVKLAMAGQLGDDELRRQIGYNVGEQWAEGFMAFWRSWKLLPDLNAILADPDTAPVHGDSAVNYALSVALASKMDLTNVGAIARYAKRLRGDYRASMWSSVIGRTDKAPSGQAWGEILAATPEYIAHMIDQRNNGD